VRGFSVCKIVILIVIKNITKNKIPGNVDY